MRARWLEQKLTDVLKHIRLAGHAKFDKFHISYGKMQQMMPWYVRRPGRETCMCRHHMEFEHFSDAIRRWKQSAGRELTPEQASECTDAPLNAQAMRQCLQCPKEGPFYKPECCMRHRLQCHDCEGRLSGMICDAERNARPMITYQKWTEVPYLCKDGRVSNTHDFMPSTVTIAEFEIEF